MKKTIGILLAALPVLVMIGLIPLVADDYILTALYLGIIAGSLMLKTTRHDRPSSCSVFSSCSPSSACL